MCYKFMKMWPEVALDAETALTLNDRMLKALLLAAEAKLRMSEKESVQSLVAELLRSAKIYLLRGREF